MLASARKSRFAPIEAERHAHQDAGDRQSGQTEFGQRHHHDHRNAAQQHAEGIELFDVDVLQQQAIDEKGEWDACIDGQLIGDDHLYVVGVPHYIRANEQLDDRQHEPINEIRNDQHPHIPRV